MSRPSAPSMPTPRQIKDALDAVRQIDPSARILRVGPEGVTFDYGDQSSATGAKSWEGAPFDA